MKSQLAIDHQAQRSLKSELGGSLSRVDSVLYYVGKLLVLRSLLLTRLEDIPSRVEDTVWKNWWESCWVDGGGIKPHKSHRRHSGAAIPAHPGETRKRITKVGDKYKYKYVLIMAPEIIILDPSSELDF